MTQMEFVPTSAAGGRVHQQEQENLSDFEVEAQERKAAWKERMQKQFASYNHKELRAWVSMYYTWQEIRLAGENKNRIIAEVANLDAKRLEEYEEETKPFRRAEQLMAKYIGEELEKIPIYRNWLKDVKGIGPITAGCLIAWIDDISKFENVSKLWQYCGLSAICACGHSKHSGEDGRGPCLESSSCRGFIGVAQRRRRGIEHLGYNPKLKTLCFKIGKSFLTSRNETYRAVYDAAHAEYEKRGFDKTGEHGANKNKLHLMYRSMKKMERVFIFHLWKKWRESEGLPTSVPYIFGPGAHSPDHMIIEA